MIDVVRSAQPPKSLQETDAYDGADVRDRLRDDFLGKCYLCEGPLPETFQIDHFRPQADFPELKKHWPNLFPAHGETCNRRRLRWGTRGVVVDGRRCAFPEGGLLNCTNGEDVEQRLVQWLEQDAVRGLRAHFRARSADDTAATNTAEELSHIHDPGSGGGKEISSLINAQYVRVLEGHHRLIQAWEAADRDRNDLRVAKAAEVLRLMLAKNAPYSTLIRDRLQEFVIPTLRPLLGLPA